MELCNSVDCLALARLAFGFGLDGVRRRRSQEAPGDLVERNRFGPLEMRQAFAGKLLITRTYFSNFGTSGEARRGRGGRG